LRERSFRDQKIEVEIDDNTHLLMDAKLARKLGAHTILMHFATSKGSWEDCRALLKDVAAVGEKAESPRAKIESWATK